jgi:hypothetical protein
VGTSTVEAPVRGGRLGQGSEGILRLEVEACHGGTRKRWKGIASQKPGRGMGLGRRLAAAPVALLPSPDGTPTADAAARFVWLLFPSAAAAVPSPTNVPCLGTAFQSKEGRET